jgi:asparagine synthase (glutamine-hydrolysing)
VQAIARGAAMSGFVGIVNFDGAPADPRLLEGLTQFLSFRGPDAQRTWCQGPVGLGHALLQTASGTVKEKQPAQLGGRLWIVADARIDARDDLIGKLRERKAASALFLSTPDAELILHAYDAWGEACVDHLLGDFSFAIWDAQKKHLFCARDHFGFRLLFYATVGNCLVFSNTLDCLRLHPGVSGKLNDLAIADFLLFERNLDLGTSAFASILRVPPAHTLRCEQGKITQSRYWKLPEAAPVSYRRPEDCIEAFREVFDAAVSDRLRGNSAGLHLSGGLDSPTVAISARRVADRRGGSLELRAFTHYHEALIPHEEKHYAGMVAESLRLPIQFLNGDNCHLFDIFDDPEFRTPEPTHPAMGYRNANPTKEIAAFSRTGLAGFGGDPALASLLSAHFVRLYRKRRFGRMFSDAAGYLSAEGRFSRLYLRTRFRRWFGRNGSEEFPPWVNPDLVSALSLTDRWQSASNGFHTNQSARPEAHDLVADPQWTSVMESEDASNSGYLVEVSYPFFDLRVLKFLLALPALPWCSDKEILRRAARGILPESVRLRKKSPLIQDPIEALLQRPESAWVDRFEPVVELQAYVLRDRIPPLLQSRNPFRALFHLRPLSLNFWLQRRTNVSYK